MNNLAFLLLALVVSVIGATVVILRNRPPVGRTEIDEFQAVMGALAPDRVPARSDRSSAGSSNTGTEAEPEVPTGEGHDGPSIDTPEGER